jgi:hypothetical protein
MAGTTTPAGPLTGPNAAAGPLVVSTENPRYFVAKGSDGTAQHVFLTGSHIWNNFHDGLGPGRECPTSPEQNDYQGYLRFLRERGHNFIRLWRWEQFRSQAAGGAFHLCMSPQPWPRTGAGAAKDGKPKFDLSKFDPTFFGRLRERVIAAGNAGMYVAVMFFEGWAIHLSPPPDNVEGHPFHAANNINGIGIESILDYQVLPLGAQVQALQEAYIKRVIDTVHDLPNVLYEVANESSGGGTVDANFAKMLGFSDTPDWGDSTEWQYWVIDVVKGYERERGYDTHPIGMTMQFPVRTQSKVNAPLYASKADWISPGYDDAIFENGGHPMAPNSPPSRWFDDPPANDGAKVVITDTDHYAPGKGDALWAWKSLLRGHQPILMDFGIIDVVNPLDPSTGVPAFESYEPARYAMGDARAFAERMDLARTTPRSELSSTRYVLANPGRQYLVLQPEPGGELWVDVSDGVYEAEWFDITERRRLDAADVAVDGDTRVAFSLPPSVSGPAVLLLTRT